MIFRKSNFVMPGALINKAPANLAERQAKQMMGAGNPTIGSDLRPAGSTACPTCKEYHRLGSVCKNIQEISPIIKSGNSMFGGGGSSSSNTAVMKKPPGVGAPSSGGASVGYSVAPTSPSQKPPSTVSSSSAFSVPKPTGSPSGVGPTLNIPKPNESSSGVGAGSLSVPKPNSSVSGRGTEVFARPLKPAMTAQPSTSTAQAVPPPSGSVSAQPNINSFIGHANTMFKPSEQVSPESPQAFNPNSTMAGSKRAAENQLNKPAPVLNPSNAGEFSQNVARNNLGGEYIRQARASNILGSEFKFDPTKDTSHYANDPDYIEKRPGVWSGHERSAENASIPVSSQEGQSMRSDAVPNFTKKPRLANTKVDMAAPEGMSGPNGTQLIDRNSATTRIGGHADIPSQEDYNRNTLVPNGDSSGGLQALARDPKTVQQADIASGAEPVDYQGQRESADATKYGENGTQVDMYAPAIAKDAYNQYKQQSSGKKVAQSTPGTGSIAQESSPGADATSGDNSKTLTDMYAPAMAKDAYNQHVAAQKVSNKKPSRGNQVNSGANSNGGASDGSSIGASSNDITPPEPTKPEEITADTKGSERTPINIPFSSAFNTGMAIGSGLDRPGGAFGPTVSGAVSGVHNALSSRDNVNSNKQARDKAVSEAKAANGVNHERYLQNLVNWQQKYAQPPVKPPVPTINAKGTKV